MSNGIYTALSGAVAQSTALDVTADNIANASTAGFRAGRVSFGEALAGAQQKGAPRSTRGVKIAPTATDGSAGALVKTGNPLDVALDGDGFFGVETARGVRWSRAGNLRLDAEQRLVTGDGNPVRARGGGAITLPQSAQEIVVAEDGTISADGEAVGAIELARFAPNAVAREGASLFAARGPALPGEGPKVVSGALESGNFNVVRGVVDLVRVSRTYDALHRMIESYREMDERTARGGQ